MAIVKNVAGERLNLRAEDDLMPQLAERELRHTDPGEERRDPHAARPRRPFAHALKTFRTQKPL